VARTSGFPVSELGASSLIDILRWRALNQPDLRLYTFLADGETDEVVITCAELDRRARAIAAVLQYADLVGERALLLYAPGLDYIAGFFGCLYAGVVAVPAYPPEPARLDRTLPRLQTMVADADATVALTTSPILSMAQFLFGQAPDLEALQWIATDTIPDQEADDWREPVLSQDSLAFLQYTSGSTHVPRGVMVSHGNLAYNSDLISQKFELSSASVGVVWLPPYHDMGLIGGILQPAYCGVHCVLMSPLDFLQRPPRWLQAVSNYDATVSGGPDFAYGLCVRKINAEQRSELDLSSWSLAFNGAEPVRAPTLERFAEVFAPCGFRRDAFYPCYGLAEATLIVSGGSRAAPPVIQAFDETALEQDRVVPVGSGDDNGRALVGCGQNLRGQKTVIVDPDSLTPCSPDRVGEIWVAGPSVAQGYWNRLDETKETFEARLADTGEGPFLRTGDLGFMRDGELFITGRLKDLIIIDGLNHYPQDIEHTLEQSHWALRPGCSAAFSVDVDARERLVVVAEVAQRHKWARYREEAGVGVTSGSEPSLSAQDVVGEIRRAVAQAHDLRVHDVVLLEPRTVPKTSSGKIQRHACRDRYLAGTLEQWEV
jgi:acyl-CoA synthetase (AMP-forming)/AMP-acid ligase II